MARELMGLRVRKTFERTETSLNTRYRSRNFRGVGARRFQLCRVVSVVTSKKSYELCSPFRDPTIIVLKPLPVCVAAVGTSWTLISMLSMSAPER